MKENKKTKTRGEKLYEQLSYSKKSAYEQMGSEKYEAVQSYCEDYKAFLDHAKTEREAVVESVRFLEARGFVRYELGDKIKKGGNYYLNNRGKSLIVFHVGSESPEKGVRLSAAHIDSPRLDLKPHPLYEETGLGYFKTHYYGGIRKYQWTTMPLALHGVVTKKNGENVPVLIGEDEGDPVFVITDLLPHLAKEQNTKTLANAFPAENLNILIASSPFVEDDGKPMKGDHAIVTLILSILNEKYGMDESDFMSAELCAVPAGRSVDVGLDRWLIGAYGHDDHVCAYPALTAFADALPSKHTLMCILADKEETGSDGVSGMQCVLLDDLIEEIAKFSDVSSSVIRAHSSCVSADVTAGFDPLYAEAFEKRNAALMGCGVAVSKYGGSGGKYSTNDAPSEFCARIRRMFDEAGVVWQTAELGKTDLGGGGTVAKFISRINIDTIDIGVPVLSMHAPFEIVSKMDVYAAYEGFKAFYTAE